MKYFIRALVLLSLIIAVLLSGDEFKQHTVYVDVPDIRLAHDPSLSLQVKVYQLRDSISLLQRENSSLKRTLKYNKPDCPSEQLNPAEFWAAQFKTERARLRRALFDEQVENGLLNNEIMLLRDTVMQKELVNQSLLSLLEDVTMDEESEELTFSASLLTNDLTTLQPSFLKNTLFFGVGYQDMTLYSVGYKRNFTKNLGGYLMLHSDFKTSFLVNGGVGVSF